MVTSRARISVFSVVAAVLLASLLAACSGEPAPEAEEAGVPGVTDDAVLVGSSLPLTGHASYLGKQTLFGALAYINAINDAGGVAGRRITVLALDDGYDPPRCVANTQQLIVEDRVFCLFSYVGTPTTVKIIPLLEEAKVPLVGSFTGADALRSPFRRSIVNIRPSYYQETAAAVDHMARDLGIDRVAVFYQYDAYGFDGLKGTEMALRSHGLAPVARGSYIRGTMDVEEGLGRILEAGPKAIVMIGTYGPCAKAIGLARARGYKGLFYAVSFVGADEIARLLGPGDDTPLLVSQVVPLPGRPESGPVLPGVTEYAELLGRYFPGERPNLVGLEGFINAKVLVEGLRRAGRNLTRERFLDAVEAIADFDVGIASPVSFDKTRHQGLERVYFTRLDHGEFHMVTDWGRIRDALAARAGTDAVRREADGPDPGPPVGPGQ
ncbi:Extracellular ligand-binding receptor [Solidesulfovibrio carbinoliphilus subsp. oakridgensis]|uniref:Extracellular ligand-binding receptor n=1 Tax=Solidesulfovibrio carbinoliphilus subsp. oakridgensis TaxID=694327 RepID=G7QDP6_9BACT|nr:ABC transporter substrate-binding protein [Solidesulfovibrio carbinoliphilus]EHJ46552.1 Extracellular ligand-binding receptor [Solidesulfovibrio carbinoliphilus subsp. oakridgensis]